MRRPLRIAASYVCTALLISSVVCWTLSYDSAIDVTVIKRRTYLSVKSAYGYFVICGSRKRPELQDVDDVNGPFDTRWILHRDNRAPDVRRENYDSVFDRIESVVGFKFGELNGFSIAAIPFWFLAIGSGLLVVAFRPKPRWRFDLRDAFAIMTIAAAVAAGFAGIVRLAVSYG